MNTETETKLITAMQQDLIETRNSMVDDQIAVLTGKKVHHLPQPKSLKEVFADIDSNDLEHQTHVYKHLLHVEGQTVIEQLRHRADMMRRRADEFNSMADSYEIAIDTAARQTGSVSDTHQSILNLLAEHAHIKPQRI